VESKRKFITYEEYLKTSKFRLKLSLVLIVLLLLIPLTQGSASQITIEVNGKVLKIDQAPVIENGRTLVPLRAIFEALGATVSYNSETQQIIGSKDNLKLELKVGSTAAYVNGEKTRLDVPAKVIKGRTLVPLRFIGESLKADVKWDSKTQKISVNSKSQTNANQTNTSNVETVNPSEDPNEMLKNALRSEDIEKVKVALNKGATPTFKHAIVTNTEIIRIMLDAGANPNEGRVLAWSAWYRDEASVKLLLERGANPNQTYPLPPYDNHTPLKQATTTYLINDTREVIGVNENIVRMLIEYGAIADPYSMTNVIYANNIGLVELFLNEGMNPNGNTPGSDMITFYSYALDRNSNEIAELLKSRGASPYTEKIDNYSEWTQQHLDYRLRSAVIFNEIKVVMELLKAGANAAEASDFVKLNGSEEMIKIVQGFVK